LDIDEIYSQFDNIEQKVELLIERCKGLESSNQELTGKNEQLEKELREKFDMQDNHAKHKEVIRSKIDSLLSKLNNFSELS
jgi:site-specific DNA-adenine methylase